MSDQRQQLLANIEERGNPGFDLIRAACADILAGRRTRNADAVVARLPWLAGHREMLTKAVAYRPRMKKVLPDAYTSPHHAGPELPASAPMPVVSRGSDRQRRPLSPECEVILRGFEARNLTDWEPGRDEIYAVWAGFPSSGTSEPRSGVTNVVGGVEERSTRTFSPAPVLHRGRTRGVGYTIALWEQDYGEPTKTLKDFQRDLLGFWDEHVQPALEAADEIIDHLPEDMAEDGDVQETEHWIEVFEQWGRLVIAGLTELAILIADLFGMDDDLIGTVVGAVDLLDHMPSGSRRVAHTVRGDGAVYDIHVDIITKPFAKHTDHNTSGATPALVSHDGRLGMMWLGRNARKNLNYMDASNYLRFENHRILSARGQGGGEFAIASHKGQLVMVWLERGGTRLLFATSNDGGGTWSDAKRVSGGYRASFPRLCSTGSALVLASLAGGGGEYRGRPRFHEVFEASDLESCGYTNWTHDVHDLDIAAGHDNVYVSFTETGNRRFQVRKYGPASHPGHHRGFRESDVDAHMVRSITCDGRPTIACHGGELVAAWSEFAGFMQPMPIVLHRFSESLGLRESVTLQETSYYGAELTSHLGNLYLAWAGTDEQRRLNVWPYL